MNKALCTLGAIFAVLLGSGTVVHADKGFAFIACGNDDSSGPIVTVAQIANGGESASLTSEVLASEDLASEDLVGLPCAEGMAKLSVAGFDLKRKSPIASGKPLLIIAEDIEGEALAALNQARRFKDILISLFDGADVSGTADCDVFGTEGPRIVAVQYALKNFSVDHGDLVDLLENAVGMDCADFAAALTAVGAALTGTFVLPIPRDSSQSSTLLRIPPGWPFRPLPDSIVLEYELDGG